MKALKPLLAVAALTSAPALQADTAVERGEQRLARMLGDRVAQAPVQCFEVNEGTAPVAIDGVAVVYDVGDVMYVGRPVNAIDPRDTIMGPERGGRWRTAANPTCAAQIFYTRSRLPGQSAGHADIREFVPYTRQK